jgi:phosphatidate cytidylyltransferase
VIKRVATAVVLIPVVLLIVFRAPLWLFAAVVTLVAGIATCEYLRLAEASGIKPAKIATYFLTGLLFASAIAAFVAEVKLTRLSSTALLRGVLPKQHPYLYFTLNAASLARDFLLLAPLVLLVAMLAREDLRSALAGAAVSALALVYVSLPFLLLITVRARAAGAFYVFYLLVVVWVGDILAFLIGGPLGKHKLAPRISPNKSWEGTLASLAGATALGTVILLGAEGIVSFARSSHLLAAPLGSILSVGAYPTPRPIWVYVLLSAAINLAAQLGDLVESMIKRGASVKDSGSLLPGHGGMLDRIDALLFAAPVLWYYAQIAAAISPR